MARYRRSYRRRGANYVWQPVVLRDDIQVPSGAVNDTHSGTLAEITPGMGLGDNFEPFNNEVVLQRIIGTMAHNGQGSTVPNANQWFPFTVGALMIPRGFSAQAVDLFDNSAVDNQVFRMDAVCNNSSTTDAIPNWHTVDQKSKRKFGVGETLSWLYSLISPVTVHFDVEFVANLRFLWKLKV